MIATSAAEAVVAADAVVGSRKKTTDADALRGAAGTKKSAVTAAVHAVAMVVMVTKRAARG
jgi:hypothetical protein